MCFQRSPAEKKARAAVCARTQTERAAETEGAGPPPSHRARCEAMHKAA